MAWIRDDDLVDPTTMQFANVTEYLDRKLGPQQLPMTMVVPITIIYPIVFVGGIVGNVLTCMVIAKNAYMHTTTNYYLFSLAVSDLLMLLLGLPLELYSFWVQYPYLFPSPICSGRALISEMTTNASILTISAFTVERYFAICHPMRAQAVSTLSRPRLMIGFIWFVAFLSATPYAYYFRVLHLRHPLTNESIPESAICSAAVIKSTDLLPLFLFSTTVFFVLPLALLTVLYVLIILALQSSQRCISLGQMRMGSSSSDTTKYRTQSRKSIVRMLAAVCVAFFICWAPFHAQRLLWSTLDYTGSYNFVEQLNGFLYAIAGCFYYSNCVINVTIYNVMSLRFRDAFRDTICICRKSDGLNGEYSSRHGTGRRLSEPAYRRQSTASVSQHNVYKLPGASQLMIEMCIVNPEGELVDTARLRQDSDDFVYHAADPFLGSQYLTQAVNQSNNHRGSDIPQSVYTESLHP